MRVLPRIRPIVYHRAHLFQIGGMGISALCYKSPRAIDMSKRVSWTLVDEQVTCKKCLAIIEAKRAVLSAERASVGEAEQV